MIGTMIAAAALMGTGFHQEAKDLNYLLVGDKALIAAPVRAIPAPGIVDDAIVSPDGRQIAVQWSEIKPSDFREKWRRPATEGDDSEPMTWPRGIGVFSVETGRFTTAFRTSDPNTTFGLNFFTGRTNQCIFTVTKSVGEQLQSSLMSFSTSGERTTLVQSSEVDFNLQTFQNDDESGSDSFVFHDDDKRVMIYTDDHRIHPLHDSGNLDFVMRFMDRGRTLVVNTRTSAKAPSTFALVDCETGARKPITREQFMAHMRVPQFDLNGGESSDERLYVEPAQSDGKAGQRVFIGRGEFNTCEKSFDERVYVWLSQGAAFTTSLIEVPASFVVKPKLTPKEEAMQAAKEVATALMMYSSDYDDTMPSLQGWQEAVYPYSKNRDLLNQFVYTYNGPLEIAAVKEPDKTELGFVSAPGGRAVSYLDGHVKWVPDGRLKGAAPSIYGDGAVSLARRTLFQEAVDPFNTGYVRRLRHTPGGK